jgi:hypothetical protein
LAPEFEIGRGFHCAGKHMGCMKKSRRGGMLGWPDL